MRKALSQLFYPTPALALGRHVALVPSKISGPISVYFGSFLTYEPCFLFLQCFGLVGLQNIRCTNDKDAISWTFTVHLIFLLRRKNCTQVLRLVATFLLSPSSSWLFCANHQHSDIVGFLAETSLLPSFLTAVAVQGELGRLLKNLLCHFVATLGGCRCSSKGRW